MTPGSKADESYWVSTGEKGASIVAFIDVKPQRKSNKGVTGLSYKEVFFPQGSVAVEMLSSWNIYLLLSFFSLIVNCFG